MFKDAFYNLLLWCAPELTVVALIKNDELSPVQLGDQGEQNVVDPNRGASGQRVAFSVWAGVELAGGSGRALCISLDEEMRDVHCVCQRLQGTRSCTACGCDQSKDSLVHQLTGWRGKEGKYREERIKIMLIKGRKYKGHKRTQHEGEEKRINDEKLSLYLIIFCHNVCTLGVSHALGFFGVLFFRFFFIYIWNLIWKLWANVEGFSFSSDKNKIVFISGKSP